MALWSSLTSYSQLASVQGSDGVTYTSLINNNLNHDPTLTNEQFWTKFWNWSAQVTWAQGAWSDGAWSPGAFTLGTWH